jgi:hypothetical protein
VTHSVGDGLHLPALEVIVSSDEFLQVGIALLDSSGSHGILE